jgi:hypothetical protein
MVELSNATWLIVLLATASSLVGLLVVVMCYLDMLLMLPLQAQLARPVWVPFTPMPALLPAVDPFGSC